MLDHLLLVHHVRNLGEDKLLTACCGGFDIVAGTHYHATATCQESLFNTLVAIDKGSRREVRTFDKVEQILACALCVVDVCAASVNNLREVVRCHIGSHTYGDTAGTIYEQQRNTGREYGRLLLCVVEVHGPIDSLLVDIGHNLVCNLLHTRLGVTHSRRRVAVHRTEVTLALNEWITHSPRLCQTHHCIIHRQVAVWVELTEHISDNTSRLTGWFVVVEVQLRVHIEKDSTMNRFQTISNIGQCTRYDDRHRVVDVGLLHVVLDIDSLNTTNRSYFLFFNHSFYYLSLLFVPYINTRKNSDYFANNQLLIAKSALLEKYFCRKCDFCPILGDLGHFAILFRGGVGCWGAECPYSISFNSSHLNDTFFSFISSFVALRMVSLLPRIWATSFLIDIGSLARSSRMSFL